jgi:hypothetical protein
MKTVQKVGVGASAILRGIMPRVASVVAARRAAQDALLFACSVE